jgi:antirestriction protein ArdC
VAINPVAQIPHKTLFHELAHVTLGHTSEADVIDTEQTPRSLREVEAETVALLCCEALELEGSEYARGYIQNWLHQSSDCERFRFNSTTRAANREAGRPPPIVHFGKRVGESNNTPHELTML